MAYLIVLFRVTTVNGALVLEWRHTMPVRIKGGFSTVGCQKPCALHLELLFLLTPALLLFSKLKKRISAIPMRINEVEQGVNQDTQ